MKNKTIGVLGGMGPVTSANFYCTMIRYAQRKHKAVKDTDFPQIIINSLPLYGFAETGVLDKELVLNQLKEGILTLENAGCDFIAIPCNTVHCFIDELRDNSKIPILSIIEETTKVIQERKIEPIGILASETSLKLKLYENALEAKQISFRTPAKEHYPTITALILNVMGGNTEDNTKILNIIAEMSKSIKGIILGCTELHSAVKQSDTTVAVFDSLTILAEASVDKALKKSHR